MAKCIGKDVPVARPVVCALSVSDGEGINIRLEVDNKAAQRGEGSTEDAHVHHDPRHCKLLWGLMRAG
jgi:hypothetical protein